MERRQVSYQQFKQRVRRHRRTDVLIEVAKLSSELYQNELDKFKSNLASRIVSEHTADLHFILAGIARTALISNNDYRNTPVTRQDIDEMRSLYMRIREPAFVGEPTIYEARPAFIHMAYEQFGFQEALWGNIGRTISVLIDQAKETNIPQPDWYGTLGVDLDVFIRIAITLYTYAIRAGGTMTKQELKDIGKISVGTNLDSDYVLEVIDRWFVSTVDKLKKEGVSNEEEGKEKWSLNPLIAKPVVSVSKDQYTVPIPRFILDRITPKGLYFIGIENFGISFATNLGLVFQSYIGRQLHLLEHVTILDEISYGKPSNLTVDFFIVTTEVVVLVEVKSTRPIYKTRLGLLEGDSDTADKINRAFMQIEKTVELIEDGHQAIKEIPNDRPRRGLVITLEPIYLLNTLLYDDILQRPSIPTIVQSANEFEMMIGLLQDRDDIGQLLLEGTEQTGDHAQPLTRILQGLPCHNPIIENAWNRIMQPFETYFDS